MQQSFFTKVWPLDQQWRFGGQSLSLVNFVQRHVTRSEMRPAHSAEGSDVPGSRGFVNNVKISRDIYGWFERKGIGFLMIVLFWPNSANSVKRGTNVKAFEKANAAI